MKEYTIPGLSASGTGPKTAGTIIGGTTIRPELLYASLGFRTNPNSSDQQVNCAISNFTAAGTAGSSPTPKPQDPSDVAAVATAGITHSAEPTLGANFWDGDINQRASKDLFWDYDKGPRAPATASNGLSSRMVAVSNALVMSCPMRWRE